MISRKFITTSLIYTVSSTLSVLASFILLPFYTNTGLLKMGDYGALTLYIALSLFVQVFANFCLDFYVSVVYHDLKDQPEKLKAKMASLNGYVIVSGLIIIALFAIGGNFFIHAYIPNPNPSSFRYLMMSVVTGVFNAHFKFYNSLLINKEKPWRFFWSNMLNFVSTIVLSVIILKMFPLTLEGPLWGRLLSGLCIFAWSFIDVTVTYGVALKKEFLKSTFQFCLPLLISTVFTWILTSSYGYVIKSLLYNEEVAIFDLAVKFTLLINFVLDGLGSAITPRIYSLMRQEQTVAVQKEINKYYSSFNLLALLIVPVNILILPIVVPIFISSDKYLQAFLYFGIVGAGVITRSLQILFVNPAYFYKQTPKLVWANGISAVLQVVVSYVLIQKFKLYGAAFSLNIVKVLQLLLLLWFCGQFITPGINSRKMVMLPMLSILIISIGEMFITGYDMRMHIIHAIEMVIIAILSWGFYKAELKDLWDWAKEKFPFLQFG